MLVFSKASPSTSGFKNASASSPISSLAASPARSSCRAVRGRILRWLGIINHFLLFFCWHRAQHLYNKSRIQTVCFSKFGLIGFNMIAMLLLRRKYLSLFSLGTKFHRRCALRESAKGNFHEEKDEKREIMRKIPKKKNAHECWAKWGWKVKCQQKPVTEQK